jgi:hypothetical protein
MLELAKDVRLHGISLKADSSSAGQRILCDIRDFHGSEDKDKRSVFRGRTDWSVEANFPEKHAVSIFWVKDGDRIFLQNDGSYRRAVQRQNPAEGYNQGVLCLWNPQLHFDVQEIKSTNLNQFTTALHIRKVPFCKCGVTEHKLRLCFYVSTARRFSYQ